MASMTMTSEPPGEAGVHRALALSLVALAAVVTFALIGLMLDGNWPKVARVGLSVAAYTLIVFGLSGSDRTPVRWWWFAGAGAIAGAVSAVVRPEFVAAIVPAQVGGGVLFGTVHWLALRYAPRMVPRH
jgi:hypothetical protein